MMKFKVLFVCSSILLLVLSFHWYLNEYCAHNGFLGGGTPLRLPFILFCMIELIIALLVQLLPFKLLKLLVFVIATLLSLYVTGTAFFGICNAIS